MNVLTNRVPDRCIPIIKFRFLATNQVESLTGHNRRMDSAYNDLLFDSPWKHWPHNARIPCYKVHSSKSFDLGKLDPGSDCGISLAP